MGSNDTDEKLHNTDSDMADVTAPILDNSIIQVSPTVPEYTGPVEPRKKRRKGWIIVVFILLAFVGVFVAARALNTQRLSTAAGTHVTYTVKRGDITITLSGSGTLQPADAYTITSLISGDILSAPFEEGDIVEKDQVLYNVDSADVNSSVKQAENNVDSSRNQYENTLKQLENLKLKAGGTGKVTELNVQQGETVQAGQTIAVIQDSTVMTVKVQFQRDLAESFYNGQNATVYIDGIFETYTGVVTNISTVDITLSGYVIARELTIEISNPGALSDTSLASASISGNTSINKTTLNYKYQGNVTATSSGTVAQLKVTEGSLVTKDQIIAVLQSDAVDQQVQSAKSALENAKLALDNQTSKITGYSIKSPISGTIVEKNYKEGDTLKAGEILSTVFDLSHLTLTLNVDELDIKKVQPGQSVTITADAAAGTEFSGTVTKINIKGTTKNGVTSYPVTIRLDKTDGLLPGMNVDAKIVVEALKDVLTVPVSAVLRQNFVLLKSDEENPKVTEAGIPAGFNYTKVTLGSANDTEVVITEGLKGGDTVAVMDNTPTSYNTYPFAQRASEGGGENGAPDAIGGSGGAAQGPASQTAAGVSG